MILPIISLENLEQKNLFQENMLMKNLKVFITVYAVIMNYFQVKQNLIQEQAGLVFLNHLTKKI